MARTHARWKAEAWASDSEFRILTRNAQWAYMMLVSQPQINNCGILPYVPERWAGLSTDSSTRSINSALRELKEQKYVAFDARTRELLVRSFIRHDNIRSQPKLVISARRQFREIESSELRGLLVANYPDLFGPDAQPSDTKPKGVSDTPSDSPRPRGIDRGSTSRARAPATPKILRATTSKAVLVARPNDNGPGLSTLEQPINLELRRAAGDA